MVLLQKPSSPRFDFFSSRVVKRARMTSFFSCFFFPASLKADESVEPCRLGEPEPDEEEGGGDLMLWWSGTEVTRGGWVHSLRRNRHSGLGRPRRTWVPRAVVLTLGVGWPGLARLPGLMARHLDSVGGSEEAADAHQEDFEEVVNGGQSSDMCRQLCQGLVSPAHLVYTSGPNL